MELLREQQLKEFVGRLPDLSETSVHLLMLTTRSRKAKAILGKKIKDLVLERKIIRHLGGNWRDRYMDAVRNLALLQQHGRYVVQGELIPVEATAIIGTICPRDTVKAAKNLIQETQEILWSRDMLARKNLNRLNIALFSNLHKYRANGTYAATLDIDVDSFKTFADAWEIVDGKCRIWMKTRVSRGYHIVLNLSDKEDATRFHMPGGVLQNVRDYFPATDVEVLFDPQEPVPGTLYYREDGEPFYVEIFDRLPSKPYP